MKQACRHGIFSIRVDWMGRLILSHGSAEAAFYPMGNVSYLTLCLSLRVENQGVPFWAAQPNAGDKIHQWKPLPVSPSHVSPFLSFPCPVLLPFCFPPFPMGFTSGRWLLECWPAILPTLRHSANCVPPAVRAKD